MSTGIRILTMHDDNTFESECVPSTNISHINARYEPIEASPEEKTETEKQEVTKSSKKDKYSHSLKIILKTGKVLAYQPKERLTIFFIIKDGEHIVCQTNNIEKFTICYMQHCVGEGLECPIDI